MTFKGRWPCIFPVPWHVSLQQNTSPQRWPIPAWELLLRHGWRTGLRCNKFWLTYQNKRNRNRGGCVVGSREGAGERFDWKHESGRYKMYGIIIVYIVSSLPTNHVKSPAQCWLWRGQDQQDSNSVTVAQCPQSEVRAQEGSHNPPKMLWFLQQRASGALWGMTTHAIVTRSTKKRHFLSFLSRPCSNINVFNQKPLLEERW